MVYYPANFTQMTRLFMETPEALTDWLLYGSVVWHESPTGRLNHIPLTGINTERLQDLSETSKCLTKETLKK